MAKEGVTRCGRCGGERLVPFVYGLPGPDLMAAAERGEVLLGGCIVFKDNPSLACAACGATWSRGTGWRAAPPRRGEDWPPPR